MGEDFFKSNFWVYWLSMFAIGPWHGALEMKLYMNRFVQHIGGMADLSTIKFTRLNQYDSLILPLVKWLEQQGVTIVYDTKVTNVVFDITRNARSLAGSSGSRAESAEDSTSPRTTSSSLPTAPRSKTPRGGTTTPRPSGTGTSRRAASGRCGATSPPRTPPSVGPTSSVPTPTRPAMCRHASVTLDDKIPPYIERICKRETSSHDGKPITGGLVTVRDSNWMFSWNVERNPHFRNHPKGQLMLHFYGQYSLDRPGNYVKKALKECTGEEIAQEWLYHLGVPEDQIEPAGGQVGDRASVHDALHHRLLHAPA